MPSPEFSSPLLHPPPGAVQRPEVAGYLIGELLGVGGSGAVWAATDPAGDAVAIKVLHPGAAARLGAEVDVLRALEHPRVVRLRGVVACGEGCALVLDRAAGGSLADLVAARGRLRPGEVVTIVSALGAALADLHGRGLVHGDITPSNILLDDSGAPFLSDWGLSAVIGLATPPGGGRTHEVLGTPGYADPARASGDPAAPSGDVWGLAATAWAALTGATVAGPGDRLPSTTGATASGAPAELLRALAAALEHDPRSRPTAAEFARRCWDAAPCAPVQLTRAAGSGTSAAITQRLRAAAVEAGAHRGTPVRRPRRRGARRRATLAAAAVLGLVIAVGGTWLVRTGVAHAQRPVARTATPTTLAPTTLAPTTLAPSSAAEPSEGGAASTDPTAGVRALAALRDRALTSGDPAILTDVDTPGSVPDRFDRALLSDLRERGVTARDRTSRLLSVEVVGVTGSPSADGSQAWVRVKVVTSAHQLLGPAGTVTDVPASRPVTSLLMITRSGGRWLIAGSG